MKTLTTLVFLFGLAFTFVIGHGYVQNITIDGLEYSGYLPFSDPYDVPVPARIVRHIPSDSPIYNATSSNLTCNVGGNVAAGATAPAKAGSTITFTMNRWPDEHHGPVTVYMANCGKSCKNFDGKGKVWFKIDEAGFYNATSVINQTWATNVLIANNLSWTVRIPDQIKAGEYLIRLELQALQTQGAPQFYPSCTQLNITSNGTDIPASNELASIPGIYKAKDVTMTYGPKTSILGQSTDRK